MRVFNCVLIIPLLTILIVTFKFKETEAASIPRQHCPLSKSSNSSLSKEGDNGIRVISLNEEKKVRIQFFYPNPYQKRRSVRQRKERQSRSPQFSKEIEDTFSFVANNTNQLDYDIFCQWKFQVSNESQYLLISFNKLYAPFSENCQQAYVSVQKQNGFANRWCGNRHSQSNSRPVQLFSKSGAMISIFRNRLTNPNPPTGFSVTVEAIDTNEISNVQNNLRVLIG